MNNFREVNDDIIKEWLEFREETAFCEMSPEDKKHNIYFEEEFSKKIPENEALDMAYRAVSEGAAGVDMGRNVLQAECPKAMLRAIRMVVHENAKPEEAFKAYELWKKDVK